VGCVEFFWEKYKSVTLHNLGGILPYDMGQWCSEDALTLTPKPEMTRRVSMMGSRSLDRLIQKVCEIPRRRRRDFSDIIINYGLGRHSAPARIEVINRYLIMNKYRQCMRLQHNDVSVPHTFPVGGVPLSWDRPCMAKPFISIGGRDMYQLDRLDYFNPRTHYVQEITPKVREFRAHVFCWVTSNAGTVPLIQEKIVDDPEQLCWNKKQGAKFKYPYVPMLGVHDLPLELTARIRSVAFSACQALGYDFGGVDLALDHEDNLWVFEVNSRMGLREKSMAVYKTAFWELYNV
jgi:hypothetical protein